MRSLLPLVLLACTPEPGDSAVDTGDTAVDTGDTGDSAADTADSDVETGDSAVDTSDSDVDTGDSAVDTSDSAVDTADTGEAVTPAGDCLVLGTWVADDGDLVFALSGDGLTWGTPATLQEDGVSSPDVAPAAAAWSAGGPHQLMVAWVDRTGTLVGASTGEGSTFAALVMIAFAGTSGTTVTPAVSGVGTAGAGIAWLDADGQVVVATSADGVMWGSPEVVATGITEPPALSELGGDLVLAWRTPAGDLVVATGTSTGSNAVTLRAGDAATPPALAATSAGLYAAWVDTAGDLVGATSTDGQAWSSPVTIQAAAGATEAPAITSWTDGSGVETLVVAWQDGTGALVTTTSTDGAPWTDPAAFAASADTRPALACLPVGS